MLDRYKLSQFCNEEGIQYVSFHAAEKSVFTVENLHIVPLPRDVPLGKSQRIRKELEADWNLVVSND